MSDGNKLLHVSEFTWINNIKVRQVIIIKSLHTSQVGHQAGANPSSYSTKRLEICYSPLDVMLVHHTVTPSMEFTGSHLYTCDRRGGLMVSALTSGSWDKLWLDGPLGLYADETHF